MSDFSYLARNMKRILPLLFAAVCIFTQSVSAQRYQPRDSWPYENEKFVDGVVRTRSGALVTSAKLNVNIADGSLHYVDAADIIMKCDMTSVYSAKIGEEVYFNVSGRMMKVLSETGEGCVLRTVLLDREKMSKTDIGYGASSATASSQSGLLMNPENLTIINTEYNAALDKRLTGEVIPTLERTYIFSCGYLIPATRDGLIEAGIDRKAIGEFLKNNKIKTKDISSLEAMLKFAHSQLKK